MRASNALSWSLLNTALSRFGTLGIGIALARILGPTEFGTFAVAMVALLAVLAFNELGVSLAIVRWQTDPHEIAPTVNTLSVASSAILTAVMWLTAPAFSAAMGAPDAAGPVQVLSLSILINGVVAAPAALLQRALMQRARTIIDQINVWLGAIVSITLAIGGMGAMSLAIGRIAGALVSGVLMVAVAPGAYRFGWNRDHARRLLEFGLPLAGASILVFLVGYADQFIIGHRLGATELGFYVLAFNLASWPVSLFSQPLRSVAPAVFARLQDRPEEMRSTLNSIAGLLSSVTTPACLAIAGASAPLIALVYGSDWAPAAPVLQWLAVLAVARVLCELFYDYLVIAAPTSALLRIQALWLVALVPALYLGAGRSVTAAAAMAAAVGVLIVIPAYLIQLRRHGVAQRPLVRGLLPSVIVGALVGAIALMTADRLDTLPALLVTLVVGSVAIVGLLYRSRNDVRMLRQTAD